VFLCVTLSDSPSLTMVSGLEGVGHISSILSPFHPLLLPSVAMAYELRETGTSCAHGLSIPIDLHDTWIKGPLAVVFAYDKLGSKPFIKAILVDSVDPGSTRLG